MLINGRSDLYAAESKMSLTKK